MGSQHQNLFEAGKGPWSVLYYQRSTLNSLFADLAVLETRGLHDTECEKIQEALRAAYALTGDIPDGSIFYSAFWEHLRQLSDLYAEWNGHPEHGKDGAKHRAECLQKMIKHRRKMLKRFPDEGAGQAFREEQLDLAGDMSLDVADQLHRSFKRATDAHPDLFPLLHGTLQKYEKRLEREKPTS